MILSFPRTEIMLAEALSDDQGSGFALGVSRNRAQEFTYLGCHFRESFHGNLEALPGSEPGLVGPQSIFDLASLTKILVTTPLLILAKSAGKLVWSDPVDQFLPQFAKSGITIAHLMAHRAGFIAHERFYQRPEALANKGIFTQEQLMDWIAQSPRTPLADAPTVYSDLGALVLGAILETVEQKPINQLFVEQLAEPLRLRRTGYRILPHAPQAAKAFSLEAPLHDFVITGNCESDGPVRLGEVHDNNCWSLGGYSAHAGLFSSLDESMLLFRHVIQLAKSEAEYFFVQPNSRPPFTHGFMIYPGLRPTDNDAWKNGIGHTGFVGTSAWYHPETDSYVVLLSNARVHPNHIDDRYIDTRLTVHTVLFQELLQS